MKKYFFVFVVLMLFSNCYSADEKSFFFNCERPITYMEPIFNDAGEVTEYKEKKDFQKFCIITYNDGKWNGFFNSSYLFSHLIEVKQSNYSELVVETTDFIQSGIPGFRDWHYPKCFIIKISNKVMKKILNTSSPYSYIVTDDKFYFSKRVSVLIICDNLRIRESPNTDSMTKVVGKLNKWDKVTAIDCTETKSKIDNLEYPWYKIRLEDGKEGWVFGGFAKIYFSEEDLQLLYKAFEKEGSEYTNQFITPDNS